MHALEILVSLNSVENLQNMYVRILRYYFQVVTIILLRVKRPSIHEFKRFLKWYLQYKLIFCWSLAVSCVRICHLWRFYATKLPSLSHRLRFIIDLIMVRSSLGICAKYTKVVQRDFSYRDLMTLSSFDFYLRVLGPVMHNTAIVCIVNLR